MTFNKVNATVNGVTVETDYILKNGDVIVVSAPAGSISINGYEYFEDSSLSLSNTNIEVGASGISMTVLTLTINFSIT